MLGDTLIIGYSNVSIDSKNRIYMPAFTQAVAGDTVVLVPEDDCIAIYPDTKLKMLQAKIDLLKGNESLELLRELRSYCESAITVATLDNQKRLCLTNDIQIEGDHVELKGSGDRVLMIGKIKYPEVYKNKK